MARTKIEWADEVWNPVTGCTKVSPGCDHCYAERMARRLKGTGLRKYARGFEVTLHPAALAEPCSWRKPRRVFVCSMGDLFHHRVPTPFVKEVFRIMAEHGRHRFLVLTKRAARMASLRRRLPWPPNVWLGVSVERADFMGRVEMLKTMPAAVRFVSFEPLLGPIGLTPEALDGIHWVIVGGESGPGARPMKPEWVRAIRDACIETGTPFFFKQWGGVNKKKAGRVLDGRTWDEEPKGGKE